jgi:four helix bundle protein
MSLVNFRCFILSVKFHKECVNARLPHYLRNQLLRASSSVTLNLGEGDSKPTSRDRLKYFHIALASCRECQAGLALLTHPDPKLVELADQLGASLYRLCHPKSH